jgi:hypothetical protein
MLLSLACSSARPQVPAYDRELALRVSGVPAAVQVGDRLIAQLALENVSQQVVQGCLTGNHGYTWRGDRDLKQRLTATDHNVCEQALRLGPGEITKWSEEVEVLESPGKWELVVWVQVADPKTCDKLGCDGRYVHSGPVSVHVILF